MKKKTKEGKNMAKRAKFSLPQMKKFKNEVPESKTNPELKYRLLKILSGNTSLFDT